MINNPNYCIYISGYIGEDSEWNYRLPILLKKLGLSTQSDFRQPFVTTIDNKKGVIEKEESTFVNYSRESDTGYMYLESSVGMNNTTKCSIVFNNHDYSKGRKGLNIVLTNNGRIIDSVNFDSSKQGIPAIR